MNQIKTKRINKKKKLMKQETINGTDINFPNGIEKHELSEIKQITTKDILGFENETVCSFSSLKDFISRNTMKAIEDMNFETMTDIQAKSIPKLLEGHDLRGTAKTGSGKTLAFLIPVLELIIKSDFKRKDGTGAIIMSPTRELSMQIIDVLKDLMKYHKQTYGLIIGGTNMEREKREIKNGLNIIVATPGRLLDHLQNTEGFIYKNLQCLVLDEADRILDIGFEKKLMEILEFLPKNRQTILFSATKSDKTKDIEKLALRSGFIEVDVDCNKTQATTDGLTQFYSTCPYEKKFLFLDKFLQTNSNKKIMVFFSTCNSVDFYGKLLKYFGVPVETISGRHKQSKRTSTFFAFLKAEKAILLCTDVAARGLDISDVDWIVQYDPPHDPKDYIHRVGRTARAGKQGKALLLLHNNEIKFISYLKNNKVNVNPMKIDWSELENSQLKFQVEKIVTSDYDFRRSSKAAFKSFVGSYSSHHCKNIFKVSELDLEKVGKSFGLPNISGITFKSLKGRGQRRIKKKK